MKTEIELPEKFSEVREYLARTQRCQLETLKKVASVLDGLGLRYYLASGTALGAARHGGFIPWDDDVDIVMPRPDYDKFEELIFTSHIGLKAYSWKYTPGFRLSFLKVASENVQNLDHSPYAIDVFALDILPKSKFVRKLQGVVRWILMQTTIVKHGNKNGLVKKWRVPFYKFLNLFLPKDSQRVSMWIQSMMVQSGDYNQDAIVGGRFSMYGDKEFMPFGVFGVNGGSEVEFEGAKFKAAKYLEKYLSNFFGDWRKLPPVENRLPHHDDDPAWFWG